MARKKSTEDNTRSMLSLWEPPAKAGSPIGVLATTFTLDTALFEEECLARFAGVQSDPLRDGALYRIEREERLAEVTAVVIADVHHCGGSRSLRWDLLASRPASGVMHAKICLLVWDNHVRVIIGSANLSSSGYRRNQECVSVLDFEGRVAEKSVIDALLEYLREVLETTQGTARERAKELLNLVDTQVVRITTRPRGLQRHLILVGPGRPSAFDQLSAYLPDGKPDRADVVSPFFDERLREEGPEAALWKVLRQRGEASLRLHVAAERADETDCWRILMPSHIHGCAPKTRDTATLSIHPVAINDILVDGKLESRPLHAKTLMLHHSNWIAWMVGSSNFTSAGMGLYNNRNNYEANVMYFLRASESDELRNQIASSGIRGGGAIDTAGPVEYAPPFGFDGEEADGPPPLPPLFVEAELFASDEAGHRLMLRFGESKGPAAWSIHWLGTRVYDSQLWEEIGKKAVNEVKLPKDGPPPSQLRVQWISEDGQARNAEWPVNVSACSVLPPPDELRGLSLAALLELLSSARPLHEAVRKWLRRQTDDDDPEGFQSSDLVDPHAKVDTTGFLIKRTQRACRAMQQISERLRQPIVSSAALGWRLQGPVGARAVLEAIERQCDPTLPDEWAFLLCEFVRALQSIKLRQGDGKLVAVKLQAELDGYVQEQRERLELILERASASLRDYAQADAKDAANEAA